jgi:hypothetical protein
LKRNGLNRNIDIPLRPLGKTLQIITPFHICDGEKEMRVSLRGQEKERNTPSSDKAKEREREIFGSTYMA